MAKMTMTIGRTDRAVVVCTDKRGVFFGYTDRTNDEIFASADKRLDLKNARMCNYWSAATKGILGLASSGPATGSKIGPKVPELGLVGVHGVITCTDEAARRWENGPWS